MVEGLHSKRAKILEIVAHVIASGDEVLTEKEIEQTVGLKGTQTIHHLLALERDGYIERGEATSRKHQLVKLTQKGWEAVGNMLLLGRIAAGHGLEALPVDDETYPPPLQLYSCSGKRRSHLRGGGTGHKRCRYRGRRGSRGEGE